MALGGPAPGLQRLREWLFQAPNSFLLLLVRHLLLVAMHLLLVASFAPSSKALVSNSFLLLVVMRAPISDARSP